MREKKNIKLDIVNLLDEIQNGKYSNIQMNYYFSQNEYSKKEREFITNIINVTCLGRYRRAAGRRRHHRGGSGHHGLCP